MNCPNCGNNIPDDSTFCTFCGKDLKQSPPQSQAPPETTYAPPQGAYAPPQGAYAPPQGAYAPPQPIIQNFSAPVQDETVTMGEWFGYLVLMAIPICNIIMMFIFAFNPKIKPSKANLARLQLLFLAIGVGIGIIVLIILAATGALVASSYRGWY